MAKSSLNQSTSLLILQHSAGHVLLKMESMRPAGSIKARGVENLIDSAVSVRGLTTYSTGNHAVAVAVAAARLGIPCQVFCPPTLTAYKRQILEAYGAQLRPHYPDSQEVLRQAQTAAQALGWLFVPLADNELLLAGYAGVIDELVQAVGPDFQLVVPVGTGSVLRACVERVQALGLSATVLGVEPQIYARFPASGPLLNASSSLADGLAINYLPDSNRQALLAIAVLTVTEAEIARTMQMVFMTLGQRIEGAAAVAVAGALTQAVPHRPTIALVTGSNIGGADFDLAIASLPAQHPPYAF